MYRGYRIVAVCPTTIEKRHTELVLYYLNRAEVFDEIRLWINENKIVDREYFELLKTPKYAFVIPVIRPAEDNTWRHFYSGCTDQNTIYVKIDGDVVYVGTNAIKTLLDYRIDHTEPFLISANVINNGICAYYQQYYGSIGKEFGQLTCTSNDQIAYKNNDFVKHLHTLFVDAIERDVVETFFIPHITLSQYPYFSINAISFFGRDLIGKADRMEGGDEGWISQIYPREERRPCVICGNSIVSHYSFFTQREFLNKNTNIFDRYEKLAFEPHT